MVDDSGTNHRWIDSVFYLHSACGLWLCRAAAAAHAEHCGFCACDFLDGCQFSHRQLAGTYLAFFCPTGSWINCSGNFIDRCFICIDNGLCQSKPGHLYCLCPEMGCDGCADSTGACKPSAVCKYPGDVQLGGA